MLIAIFKCKSIYHKLCTAVIQLNGMKPLGMAAAHMFWFCFLVRSAQLLICAYGKNNEF